MSEYRNFYTYKRNEQEEILKEVQDQSVSMYDALRAVSRKYYENEMDELGVMYNHLMNIKMATKEEVYDHKVIAFYYEHLNDNYRRLFDTFLGLLKDRVLFFRYGNVRSYKSKEQFADVSNIIGFAEFCYLMQRLDFSLEEYLKGKVYFEDQAQDFVNGVFYAAALSQEGRESTEEILSKMVYENEGLIHLSHSLIFGMLASTSMKTQDMVMDLLKTAQRSEGLRQSIVGQIDFAQVQVYERFLEYIVKANLIRFSSVKQSFSHFIGLEMRVDEKNLERLPKMILEALRDEEVVVRYLLSDSAFDLYIGLYAAATRSLEASMDYIDQYIGTFPNYKKVACILFILRCNRYVNAKMVADIIEKENDDSLSMHLLSMTKDQLFFPEEKDKLYYLKMASERFSKIKGAKPKTYSLLGQTITMSIDYDRIIGEQIQLADMMKDHYEYGYLHAEKMAYPTGFNDLSHEFVRNKLVEMLGANGSYTREFAYKKLKNENVILNKDQYMTMAGFMKSKRSDLRRYISELFLKAEEEVLIDSCSWMLAQKKVEYQNGALSMLVENQSRIEDLSAYNELLDKVKQLEVNDSNTDFIKVLLGDKEQKSVADLSFFEQSYQPEIEDLSYAPENVESFLQPDEEAYISFAKEVIAIYETLRGKEFEKIGYYGDKSWAKFGYDETVIGSRIHHYNELDRFEDFMFYEDFLKLEPLVEDHKIDLYRTYSKWIYRYHLKQTSNYYQDQKDKFDRLTALHYFPSFEKTLSYIETLDKKKNTDYWESIINVLSMLRLYKESLNKIEAMNQSEYFLDIFHYMLKLDSVYLKEEPKLVTFNQDIEKLAIDSADMNNEKTLKRIMTAVFYADEIESSPLNTIGLNLLFTFVEKGLLEKDYIYQLFMDTKREGKNYFSSSNAEQMIRGLNRLFNNKKATQLEWEIYDRAIGAMLDVELERTENDTIYTKALSTASVFRGTETFIKAIYKMGKMPFVRGYNWGGSGRKDSFSNIIYHCVPGEGDNQGNFDELVKKYKIREKKLLEATMYNLDFIDFTEENLKIKGLKKAAFFFKAHIKDSLTEKEEARIRRYTDLDFKDLADGQMDINWFKESYKELGKAKFDKVYDASLYISSGSNHKRAQYFADAVLGHLKEKEVLERIKDKRNKDMVLAYGLLPLKGKDKTRKALKRYTQLQTFIKESRQYGAQRRATELLKANIAINNLARNSGYSDVNRFVWNMETALIGEKKMFFENKTVGDIQVRLSLISPENPEILVEKNGKSLKSIPTKYKKNTYIKELLDTKKLLKEQFKRARTTLEESMINEDCFMVSELQKLKEHPVIGGMLGHLLFMNTKKDIGFLKEGQLITLEARIDIDGEEALTLAHPVHMNEQGIWTAWQEKLINEEIKQPFRQIFRELYTMTPEEEEQDGYTDRFAGYQVQGRQALGILKSRNWMINDYEGFEKINHKHNLRIDLYTYADWFVPSEIEAPTLERVVFMNNKTGKVQSMKDLSKVMFSETMRDLDLLVSVAYVGGVDVELNQSTIDMRKRILNYNLALFKINNYETMDHHIIVHGSYGNYSIHLGSGVIHQEGKGMLPVFPVHSQERGHIFLPFVDEDPKTAEIISKVLMLSKDDRIKDPNILRHLR